jgi:hypothetical protein
MMVMPETAQPRSAAVNARRKQDDLCPAIELDE